MISGEYFKVLENANRELALRFEKLHEARASDDTHAVKRAEMRYFHALQHLNTVVETAVALFRN